MNKRIVGFICVGIFLPAFFINSAFAASASPKARNADEATKKLLSVAGRTSLGEITRLIKEGADVNAADSESGMTPLMYAAANNTNPNVFKALIESGALVNAVDKEGSTPLMIAAAKAPNRQILLVLIENGANVNAADMLGWTCLYYAAFHNSNPNVMRVLIENGANINAVSKDGWTPLMIAAMHNVNPEVIQLLIEKGADATARDNKGYRALDFADENKNNALKGSKAYKLLREKTPPTAAEESLRIAIRDGVFQYLSAAEIQNIINKYVKERPLAQIKRELGEPTKQTEELAFWFKENNGAMISMLYNSRTKMAKLVIITEFFKDSNQRDERYNRIIADFEKIHAAPPNDRIEKGATWYLKNGWGFDIVKTSDDLSGETIFKIVYRYSQ